jgi:hypothetical protein
MKKLFTILFFVVISASTFAQQPCQAYFTYTFNPAGGTYVNLYDASYNMDSTQINVTTWTWTAAYGGAVYTYTGPNPTIQLNGYSGNIPVCLTITTTNLLQTCQSTWCDTVILSNTPPLDTCISAFTYIDTTTHLVHFIDQSSTTNGSIDSWNWVFTDVNSGTIVYNTNNYQNPYVQLAANGLYQVCLTITSDSGCTTTHCGNIYIQDSMNTACQLTVTSLINHVSVINGTDGSIDLSVTGGNPPYTYQWNTGATTQDIDNLSSGVYSVAISTNPACPNYTYTFFVGSPLDSSNIVIDTLYSPAIDTCLNFIIDSFYVAGITIQGNTVIVHWVFMGGGLTSSLYANYTFSYLGTQVVILSIQCGAKSLTNFSSYIYINQIYVMTENSETGQVNLYPNPANDFLNITFAYQTTNSSSIKIYNNVGQQVYSGSISSGSAQVGINVSWLPSGVYFVQIDMGNAKPIVRKFLK